MTAKRAGGGREAGGQPSFEKSLARLEDIVRDMEDGQLGLEEMIARFEEGQALLKFCAGKLNEVERRIEILVKKGADVVAEPFEPEAGGAGAEAGAGAAGDDEGAEEAGSPDNIPF